MKLYGRILVLLIAMLTLSQAAWAAPRFSILGGVNKSLADSTTTTVLGQDVTLEPAMGFQGGLEVGFGLSPWIQFDVGALYLSAKIKSTATVLGQTIEETGSSNFLHFPAQFRVKLGKVFSIGAGGYYSLHMTDGATDDYGYLGSARISLPTGSSAIFVDGRYLGGLKSPDGGGDKFKGWQAMAGVTFGGGK